MKGKSATHPLTILSYAMSLLMLLLAFNLGIIVAVAVVALIGRACIGFLARPHIPKLLHQAAERFDSIDD